MGHRLVLPSLLFLDDGHDIVRDEPAPEANYNSRMMTSGLDGMVALADGLEGARFVLLYVHPELLGTGVTVHGGHWQTRVPFNPYGVVRVRFHPAP